MNFITLRDQLQTWTLGSDEQLYHAIKQLSENIFEAQKNILSNIESTRYEVAKGQTEVGCSFNHYLKVSESKFTENKIGAKVESQIEQKEEKKEKEVKSKMDIFKEAIDMGVKNLDIQEDKISDNVSVSDNSLSQMIYKDSKCPAYFGTKQFTLNSFLNLFNHAELDESIIAENFELNELLIPHHQDKTQSLPPPPNISDLHKQSISPNSNQKLPPPPPIGSLPPPPPIGSLPPPPPIGSLSQPPPIGSLSQPPSLGSLPPPPPPPPPPALTSSSSFSPSIQAQKSESSSPKRLKKSLSMQEELSLRLKHGKDYKKQMIEEEEPITIENPMAKNLSVIQEERESFRNSARDSIRNSIKIGEELFLNPFQKKEPLPEKEQNQLNEQEDINELFGAKSKPREAPRVMGIEDSIMSRRTFNDDLLFKKKQFKIDRKEIMNEKPSIFKEDSDKQIDSEILFEKKSKKVQKRNTESILPGSSFLTKQKKEKKGFFESQSDPEDDDQLFKKKEKKKAELSKPIQSINVKKQKISEPKKDEVNPLEEMERESERQKQAELLARDSVQSKGSNYAKKMGGMGMPLLMPGMKFTKPSEAKKEEAAELQKRRQEKERKEQVEALKKKQQQKKVEEQQVRQRQGQRFRMEQEQKKIIGNKVEEKTEIKVTLPQIPKESESAIQKNKLFDEDDEDEDFFKPKQKPKVTKGEETQSIRTVQKDPDPQASESEGLKTRRKKAKATMNKQEGLFGDKQKEQVKQIPVMNVIQNANQLRVSHNPLEDNRASTASSYAQKAARMGGMGLPGLGPLMPKGMVITKPSEAKKMEQEVMKKLEEEKKACQAEKLQQRQAQQQSEQKKRQQNLERQRQQREEKLRKQQSQRRRQAEERQRQMLRRKRMDEEQAFLAEEERKKREEEDNRIKQQEEELRKNHEKEERQNQEEKLKQKKQEGIQKMPFIPKIAGKSEKVEKTTKGLQLPAIPNFSNKGQAKKGFPLNNDDEETFMTKKPPLAKKALRTNLFDNDDDDDDDFLKKHKEQPVFQSKPTFEPKPTLSKTSKFQAKKNLFDDDDDDDNFFSKKPTKAKQPGTKPALNLSKKNNLFNDKEEPQIPNKLTKASTGLFDNDSDDSEELEAERKKREAKRKITSFK